MTLLPAFVGAPEVNRVYNVDAMTLLRAIPSGSVDAIVTDPPYGINKATWDSRFPTDWISEAWRVTSRILVMTGNPELFEVAQAVGRVKACVILHNRNGMSRSNISFGNWIPVLACGDWDWQSRPNHISFNVVPTEKINHPDPKPLQAMMKLLQYYTCPDWLVCDPFAGSGSTLIAAQQHGRQYIGCDLSADYCDLARARLAQPYTLPLFAAANATA